MAVETNNPKTTETYEFNSTANTCTKTIDEHGETHDKGRGLFRLDIAMHRTYGD
jgi:hypothetical protein